MDSFESALRALINRFGVDNDNNIPDFILAELLRKVSDAVGEANNQLIEYRGDHCSPEMSTLLAQLKDSNAVIRDLLDTWRASQPIPKTVMQAEQMLDRIRNCSERAHHQLESTQKILSNYEEYAVQRATASATR